MPERAALYIRVSTEEQRKGNSIQTQQKDMLKRCLEKDYVAQPQHIYIESETALDTWRDRPVLQQVLASVRRQEIDVVLCWVGDRFARGEDLIVLWSELNYYDVRLESMTENLSDTPEGRVMLHIISITSRMEHARIKQRMEDNKRTSVLNGNLLGGKPLYGYEWENPTRRTKDQRNSRNRLVVATRVIYVDADGFEWTEAKVVIVCFRMIDEGKTLYYVQQWLRLKGIKTREGVASWQHATLSRMLRNRSYIGEATAYKRTYTRVDGKKHYKPVPLDERIVLPEGVIPPILVDENGQADIALFERVQERLRQNKQYASRKNPKPEDALLRGGFIKCGYCKNNLVVHHRIQDGKVEYRCDRGFQMKLTKAVSINNDIDEVAWQEACKIIRDPQKIRAIVQEMQKGEKIPEGGQSIPSRLQELEEEIIGYVDLLRTTRGETAKARIKFWLDAAEQEQALLLEEQKKSSLIQGRWDLAYAEVEHFESWCASIRDKLDSLGYNEKRMALEKLGLRVYVFEHTQKPRYKIFRMPPKIGEIVRQLSR